MRFLVSGGPTREYLDDVRFLGNPSTGALGIAVAEAARDRGHETTLVLGPTHLPPPQGVRTISVVSALDMLAALQDALPGHDALIMTAAVSDYRPLVRAPGKIKKGGDRLDLPLAKNPDILAQLSKIPHHAVRVGFALEAAGPDEAVRFAREKLEAKGLDLIVCNRSGSFGGDAMEGAILLSREGDARSLGSLSKAGLARLLVEECERLAEEHPGNGDSRI